MIVIMRCRRSANAWYDWCARVTAFTWSLHATASEESLSSFSSCLCSATCGTVTCSSWRRHWKSCLKLVKLLGQFYDTIKQYVFRIKTHSNWRTARPCQALTNVPVFYTNKLQSTSFKWKLRRGILHNMLRARTVVKDDWDSWQSFISHFFEK